MMACVTGGEPGRALDLLEQMKANKGGVNAGPDIVTYTSAIMACSSKGEIGRQHLTYSGPGCVNTKNSSACLVGKKLFSFVPPPGICCCKF